MTSPLFVWTAGFDLGEADGQWPTDYKVFRSSVD